MHVIHNIRHGLVVRIAGSHPAGPGSIPGGGKLFPDKSSSTNIAQKHFRTVLLVPF